MISKDKSLLRKEMLSKRLALTAKDIKEKSIKLANKFLDSDYASKYHTIMAFMPFKNEVDTIYIINYLLSEKKRVVLPRVNKAKHTMTAHAVSNITDDLVSGVWGILEPVESLQEISPAQIDLILIPGVAFDKRGFRLGYGGGFYDRFLIETKGIKVGIGFDFQLITQVPVEEWDVPLDRLLTDEDWYL